MASERPETNKSGLWGKETYFEQVRIIHKLLTDKLKHPRKCSNSKIPADEKLVQTSILSDQRA